MNQINQPPQIEERRLKLEQERLRLDSSFARKWRPTLATIVIGFLGAVFAFAQYINTTEETKRARIDANTRETLAQNEARTRNERDWSIKIVEMYLNKRELFDLSRNKDQAEANLLILSAVAPNVVKSLLHAETARIPPPGAEGEENEGQRLESLAAVAQIQSAIKSAKGEDLRSATTMVPSDFIVYIQYAEGSRNSAVQAQEVLQNLGFRTSGIEQVWKVPSQLQVRYYRPEQKDFAGGLAAEISKIMGLQVTADNAVQIVSQKQLPSGILELWLPQAATQ